THCLDCGELKDDGHLGDEAQRKCSKDCIRCGHPHNGEHCPNIYASTAWWKKHELRCRLPSLEECQQMDIRMRPTEIEAEELIHRG
ncbi:hypothetical protein CC86DRAFT_303729, partial [Ophiobolus disseminans]